MGNKLKFPFCLSEFSGHSNKSCQFRSFNISPLSFFSHFFSPLFYETTESQIGPIMKFSSRPSVSRIREMGSTLRYRLWTRSVQRHFLFVKIEKPLNSPLGTVFSLTEFTNTILRHAVVQSKVESSCGKHFTKYMKPLSMISGAL